MEAWMLWFVFAGVVLTLEIVTGTFYLIMISIGLAAGGIAALWGFNLNIQALVSAIVWIVATLILRRTRLGKPRNPEAEKDPNVNMDIGQHITVNEWSALRSARVMYRGALWDVELMGDESESGAYIIREVRANRLFVEKA